MLSGIVNLINQTHNDSSLFTDFHSSESGIQFKKLTPVIHYREKAQLICIMHLVINVCLRCFDTVVWASGRASGL